MSDSAVCFQTWGKACVYLSVFLFLYTNGRSPHISWCEAVTRLLMPPVRPIVWIRGCSVSPVVLAVSVFDRVDDGRAALAISVFSEARFVLSMTVVRQARICPV